MLELVRRLRASVLRSLKVLNPRSTSADVAGIVRIKSINLRKLGAVPP